MRIAAARSYLTTALVVMAAAASITVVGEPADAADNCQHFTHSHYHFPYAHRDTHRYDGSHWHYDDFHYHHYYNEQHLTPYEKRC